MQYWLIAISSNMKPVITTFQIAKVESGRKLPEFIALLKVELESSAI